MANYDTWPEWLGYMTPLTWGQMQPRTSDSLMGFYWGWFFPCVQGVEQVEAPIQVGPTDWRYRYWSSAGYYPYYYVYVDESLYCVDRTGTTVVHATPGEKLSIEVTDDPDGTPASAESSRRTLEWSGVPTAAFYRIDEWISAAWTQRAIIPADGREVYRWQSRPLEDVAAHKWRVMPVGFNGRDGTARTLVHEMVRPEDSPQVEYSYAAGDSKVTITAAT
jgi:hypothetical protein